MAQGNKGKFSERIKRIAFRKRNRMIYGADKNDKVRYQNVLKVLAAIPGMVYSNVHIKETKKSINNISVNKKERKDSRRHIINDIDVNKIKEKQEVYFSVKEEILNVCKTINDNVDLSVVNNNFDIVKDKKLKSNADNSIKIEDKNSTKQGKQYTINGVMQEDNYTGINKIDYKVEERHGERVEKLEKDILDIIKKKLVLSINTLEILQSELYILSEVNGDVKNCEECEKQIKEIKEILNRIEKLKQQYDFLKDNYDFEYLMALDDDNLIDKIIELKNVFDSNQVRAFVKDYKLLDEYKFLYLRIDKLQDKTNELEEEKERTLDELKKRDIDFDELKNKVYNAYSASNMYKNMIKEQNEIMSKISKEVAKIDSYEQVDYHIKGLNKLMINSFKYLGLLMLNPLKGIFPAIAVQTLMARDMLRGVYLGLKWEEEKKIVYSATDYSLSIEQAINNMDYVSNSIDNVLGNLISLKVTYNDKFKDYQNDNNEYKEVIDKINDMANKMMGNKIKVEIMKKRALEQKKANEKKLFLVNKLNEEQNK